jgi:gluconate 2-dehydrogenase gamma chain
MNDDRNSNSRRDFVKSALITISSATLAGTGPALGAIPIPDNEQRFFNDSEKEFLRVAVDRLIPPDEHWPGAAEAGVVNYIDLQMGGAWGHGDLLYMSGPHRQGSWTQGYQLEYTPADLFRRSIAAINKQCSAKGTPFSSMSNAEKDTFLTRLEKGELHLDGVPSDVFFEALLDQTVQGFLSDPIYGGNKDKVGWRMLGFPGAYADYFDLVDKHGIEFKREPMGIGDTGMADMKMPGQGGR